MQILEADVSLQGGVGSPACKPAFVPALGKVQSASAGAARMPARKQNCLPHIDARLVLKRDPEQKISLIAVGAEDAAAAAGVGKAVAVPSRVADLGRDAQNERVQFDPRAHHGARAKRVAQLEWYAGTGSHAAARKEGGPGELSKTAQVVEAHAASDVG